MANINMLVVPAAFSAARSVSRDRWWYNSYFFSTANGQAAFWLKQSNGKIFLQGSVSDLAVFDGPLPPSGRVATSAYILGFLETEARIDLAEVDVIVVVIARTQGVVWDGGSTT